MLASRIPVVAAFAASLAGGCQTFKDIKTTAYNNARSLVTSSYDDRQAEAKVARAEELMQAGQFDDARPILADVAGNQQNPVLVAEKARYLQGECYREIKRYPEAVDTYHKMLVDFPGGAYRERACQRMFAIADYWLDDTRAEIQAEREGKSVIGDRVTKLVKLDKSKPTLDQEGRALQALEYVHTNDITGPTADKALYWAGYVHFYRGNYQEADHFFSLLVEMHADSPLRQQATELAIIAKNNSTGGSQYDGQKSAEALQLVGHAEATMPEFRTPEKSEFLSRQKMAIRMQQADKDFKVAEYYERSRHPGSAYFYYELVKKRYPGTKYAEMAEERVAKLKDKVTAGDGHSDPVDVMISGWDRLFRRKTTFADGDRTPPNGPKDRVGQYPDDPLSHLSPVPAMDPATGR
jgi:tetratricopeptide (TPR) repeat protein